VTPSVAAPGDTNLSDATGIDVNVFYVLYSRHFYVLTFF